MKLDDLRHSIRERRQELHISAESLANKSKTTKAIILNFENGKTGLTVDTLIRIFDALGMELLAATNGTAAVFAKNEIK